MIRFEPVRKGCPGGALALNDLSFEAGSGEITVLVGPSGSGKTTSLRMINRMVEPDSGRVGSCQRSEHRHHGAEAAVTSSSRQGCSRTRRSWTTSPRPVPLLTGRTRRQARAGAANLTDHDQFRHHFPYSTIHTW
ncbi:ATP-binding cassette domain-containing protein [Streptomyces sp. NPDC057284]|uniref:ATP-binding cassette domain-containing protein n=1 Tax=Streptomyces sp. NPDC057284 TaxID=3346083 RepID=UPI003633C755